MASILLCLIKRCAFPMRALRSSSEMGTTPSVILFSWRIDSGGSRCCKNPGPAKANPATPAETRRKSLLSVHIVRAMLHDVLTRQQVREIYQPVICFEVERANELGGGARC